MSRFSNRENIVQCSGGKVTQCSRRRAFEEYNSWVCRSLGKVRGLFDNCESNFLRLVQLFFFETEMKGERTVSTRFPRNVRVESDEPRKVEGFESFRY